MYICILAKKEINLNVKEYYDNLNYNINDIKINLEKKYIKICSLIDTIYDIDNL